MLIFGFYKDHVDSLSNWADRTGSGGVSLPRLELTPGELVCPVTGFDCDRVFCESFCHGKGCRELGVCRAYNKPAEPAEGE